MKVLQTNASEVPTLGIEVWAGVDQASETVSGWLEEAGRILSKQKHICRRMLFA